VDEVDGSCSLVGEGVVGLERWREERSVRVGRTKLMVESGGRGRVLQSIEGFVDWILLDIQSESRLGRGVKRMGRVVRDFWDGKLVVEVTRRVGGKGGRRSRRKSIVRQEIGRVLVGRLGEGPRDGRGRDGRSSSMVQIGRHGRVEGIHPIL